MPRVQLANGDLRDQIKEDIYDTVTVAAGNSIPAQVLFFTSVQGKSIVDTNLKLNGTFENQVSFLVQGIGFDAQTKIALNSAVLPSLVDLSALTLFIGDKDYLKTPLRFVAGRISNFDADLKQFGSHAPSVFPLRGADSIAIPPLQTFSVTLQLLNGTNIAVSTDDLRLVCSLKGLKRRPVQ